MNRSLKNLALLVSATTVSCLYAAGQFCTTPVNSWEGSYTLSTNATIACPNSVVGNGTCTYSQGATASPTFRSPTISCTSLSWASPTDTVTSIAINDSATAPCVPPPGNLTETIVGNSGKSQSTLTFDLSKGTYNYFQQPYASATGTMMGCGISNSGPLTPGLFPASNWPQTFALPATIQPLTVTNFNFQGLDLLFADPSNVIPWTYSHTLTPAADCEPCKQKNGPGMPVSSAISAENGSLSEDLPVAGTAFTLNYESSRTPGAAASAAAIAEAAMIGGWTLNVHHAYDLASNTLLLGNGTQRNGYELGTPLLVNNQILLTSEDGSEVYVFSLTTGKHVQTLRPMTGALLYQFGFDAAGNLITITDAGGNVTTIQRDPSEHPTAIVAPFGETTTLTVDANGFLSQVTDPAGKSVVLVNSANGLLTSRTDANGNIFNYTYDANGRLSKDADPLGGSVTLARTNANSGLGWTVGETTSMGRTRSYQTTMTMPWALSNTSTVDEQHTITWPNGLQATSGTTLQNSQLTNSMALPDGTTTSETLGADPRFGLQTPVPISGTETLGNLTMTMTGTRTATVGTPGNPFTLITQTDTETINGRTYKTVFTTSTRTYVDTSPVKRTVTAILDLLERPSSVQVGALSPVTFAYDSRGRISTITQSTRTSTLAYDTNGFLASSTDPLGLTTSFTHDADGRLLTTTLPDSRVITYTYDANGNLTSITPPGKSAHDFSYTVVDLLSVYTPPVVAGTGATSYTFNTDRDLTTITRPDSETISFGYDTAGRLSSTTTPTETIGYAYDSTTGNLSSASISGGEALVYGYNGLLPTSSALSGTVAGTVSRTYNNNFWVASESINGGTTVNLTYDKDGLLTKVGSMTLKRDPKDGLVTGTTLGSATDIRKFSTFGELTGYTAKYTTTVLDAVSYTRDADGRISAKTETIGGKKTTYAYTYDQTGRLTAVKENGAAFSSYTYDSNSNRLSATTSSGTVTGTYDAQDRLLTYGNASFTYTANGELASQTIGAQTATYSYDVLGNLNVVTLPNGNNITYLIDPENHRVGKSVNGALQTSFLYDDDRILAQLNSRNQIVSQFVYGSSPTTPDYMVTGGVTYRIITDQLGSPRVVLNTATGAIAERIDYDEFGYVLQDTNPGFQPFGFAGGIYDQDTKLVRFGARDYNPSIGRWTAKDPIVFGGGDPNLYAYGLSDPVNSVDPSGLDGESCICKQWDQTKKAIKELPTNKTMQVAAGRTATNAGNIVKAVGDILVSGASGNIPKLGEAVVKGVKSMKSALDDQLELTDWIVRKYGRPPKYQCHPFPTIRDVVEKLGGLGPPGYNPVQSNPGYPGP